MKRNKAKAFLTEENPKKGKKAKTETTAKNQGESDSSQSHSASSASSAASSDSSSNSASATASSSAASQEDPGLPLIFSQRVTRKAKPMKSYVELSEDENFEENESDEDLSSDHASDMSDIDEDDDKPKKKKSNSKKSVAKKKVPEPKKTPELKVAWENLTINAFRTILNAEINKAKDDQDCYAKIENCVHLLRKGKSFSDFRFLNFFEETIFGKRILKFPKQHSVLATLIKNKEWSVLEGVFQFWQNLIESSEDFDKYKKFAKIENLHLRVALAILESSIPLKTYKEYYQHFNFNVNAKRMTLTWDSKKSKGKEITSEVNSKLLISIFSFFTKNLKDKVKYLIDQGTKLNKDDFIELIKKINLEITKRNRGGSKQQQAEKSLFELFEQFLTDPTIQASKKEITEFVAKNKIHPLITQRLFTAKLIDALPDKYEFAIFQANALQCEGYQATCEALKQNDPDYLNNKTFKDAGLFEHLVFHQSHSQEAVKLIQYIIEHQPALIDDIKVGFLYRLVGAISYGVSDHSMPRIYDSTEPCDEFYALFPRILNIVSEKHATYAADFKLGELLNQILSGRASIYLSKLALELWALNKPYDKQKYLQIFFKHLCNRKIGKFAFSRREIDLETLRTFVSSMLGQQLTYENFLKSFYEYIAQNKIDFSQKQLDLNLMQDEDENNISDKDQPLTPHPLTFMEELSKTPEHSGKLSKETLNQLLQIFCRNFTCQDQFVLCFEWLERMGAEATATIEHATTLFSFVSRTRLNLPAKDKQEFERKEIELLKYLLNKKIDPSIKCKLALNHPLNNPRISNLEFNIFEYIAWQNMRFQGSLQFFERFFLEQENYATYMQQARDTIQTRLAAQGDLRIINLQNEAQSVHRAAVHRTVSKSAEKLANHYLPVSERKVKVEQAMNAIQKFLIKSLVGRLTPSQWAAFLGHPAPEIPSAMVEDFLYFMPHALALPSFIGHKPLNAPLWGFKEHAALRWLLVTRQMPILQAFKDPQSKLSINELLAAVWYAINDATIYQTEDDRRAVLGEFIFTLWKAQREYNIQMKEKAEEKRKEADALEQQGKLDEANKIRAENQANIEGSKDTYQDSPSCPGGVFNMLTASLQDTHPLVVVKYISADLLFTFIRDFYESVFIKLTVKEKNALHEAIRKNAEGHDIDEDEWMLPESFVSKYKPEFIQFLESDIKEGHITLDMIDKFFVPFGIDYFPNIKAYVPMPEEKPVPEAPPAPHPKHPSTPLRDAEQSEQGVPMQDIDDDIEDNNESSQGSDPERSGKDAKEDQEISGASSSSSSSSSSGLGAGLGSGSRSNAGSNSGMSLNPSDFNGRAKDKKEGGQPTEPMVFHFNRTRSRSPELNPQNAQPQNDQTQNAPVSMDIDQESRSEAKP